MARAPVARLDHEKMMDEIQVDLERPRAVRDGRRREALRRDIERGRPRVVDPWRLREPDLADDLQPAVERRLRFAPRCERQVGPLLDGYGIRHDRSQAEDGLRHRAQRATVTT
jgi:hypothetical protein